MAVPADRYAIGYYVVTRNMVHDWNPTLDPLDPARYNMSEQTFDLTLQNLRGTDAKVMAWDPITDQTVPITILAADHDRLTVRLQAVDYPRFLSIQESQQGPLILVPELSGEPEGHARVSFRTNLPVKATVTWDRGRNEIAAAAWTFRKGLRLITRFHSCMNMRESRSRSNKVD
jgi:hypothetical protein